MLYISDGVLAKFMRLTWKHNFNINYNYDWYLIRKVNNTKMEEGKEEDENISCFGEFNLLLRTISKRLLLFSAFPQKKNSINFHPHTHIHKLMEAFHNLLLCRVFMRKFLIFIWCLWDVIDRYYDDDNDDGQKLLSSIFFFIWMEHQ
jgi:hypothetical protein